MVIARSGRLHLPAFIHLNPIRTQVALSRAIGVLAVVSMLVPNFAALAGAPREQLEVHRESEAATRNGKPVA